MRVAADDRRRVVFDAALEQAQQLAASAQSTPAAARPILLFYSLSQAGRAIAAAHGEGPWEVHGHGLHMDVSAVAIDEQMVEIRPSRRHLDSLTAVASAVGAPKLEGEVELGAVWAAIPELRRSAPPLPQPPALEVLAKFDDPADDYSKLANPAVHVIYPYPSPAPPNREALKTALHRYPAARHADPLTLPNSHDVPLHPVSGYGHLPEIRFTGRAQDVRQAALELDAIAPRLGPMGERFLLPALPIAPDWAPSPIVLWWLFLYALSVMARYEPARWAEAIDVKNSHLAVPLEVALDTALEAIPRLVLSTLVGFPLSVAADPGYLTS